MRVIVPSQSSVNVETIDSVRQFRVQSRHLIRASYAIDNEYYALSDLHSRSRSSFIIFDLE
jgi:hypothetical protein